MKLFDKEVCQPGADALKYGSLPLDFQLLNENSVSAQVGHASLTAGLAAGVIGLSLVTLYLFAYYRGLGLVAVSSLLLAALLAYLSVVLLSTYESFSMTLSAIAGLVVAIGITADSFIVYFERLRDAIRDGSALRPATERLETRSAHHPDVRHGVVPSGGPAVPLRGQRRAGVRLHPRPDHPDRRHRRVPFHQAHGDPARRDAVLRRRAPLVRPRPGPTRRQDPLALLNPVIAPDRPGVQSQKVCRQGAECVTGARLARSR
jgi:hypothetical protein